MKSIHAILLAAGKGTRMKSDLPKVLHELNGKAILDHVMGALRCAGIRKIYVVAGYGEKEVRALIGNRAKMVRQMPQLGTAHAVLCAEKAIGIRNGLLLVLPGDAPCVHAETIRAMVSGHGKSRASVTILTAEVENPFGYGRILRQDGNVIGVREELDASETEREISEINSGIYLFDAHTLFEHLHRVRRNARKSEYYLTDVIESFVESGLRVIGYQGSESEVLGINSRVDLAKLEKVMNIREIEKHQKNGVTVVAPCNTFIASGVAIGKDSTIYPFSWIEQGVKIGQHCHIGPFAVIRRNSSISDEAIVGSFVEVVRSKIGKKTRVKHLSYIGDAELGENVNIGAGTVTANFDGVRKQKTVIQKGASIGSNTVLIAPVRIGKQAKTGAGSVVLGKFHIPAGKTAVGVPARLIQKNRKRK